MDQATIQHYQDLLTKSMASLRNVTFVEYDHFWTHEHFVDPLHVNNKGSEKLSRLAAGWYLDGLPDLSTPP